MNAIFGLGSVWTEKGRNILSENYLGDQLGNLGRIQSAETGLQQSEDMLTRHKEQI